ncbi:putative solute carrier family 36 (proton-coupled amino acid transporter) [Monocercomonoides exilis]|uniref:putative solute carrier family 36 (proton-coupled amino acid transporter) n=1 Tax=Monocercomonoides exilis TaxID=2049356 RepID=UPI00355A70E3|nr:putative solute carrier family 36 (proton-coupled amino acid transporter) [Monocercomonoides exilis]|eukprot:MONOS_1078.1-p1 / transcript=MONOS_1078.1 / gene=MONOS_1078 / organism=Monocercomonoides_exilis_PA203 / gene_product=unspecified product / transcript_product=unspecified product / location=Mono_scaffold00018:115360-117335(-) / protein_length=326 / sequence_SO=supercontig / SO=protein_coding / is_pseudo=false
MMNLVDCKLKCGSARIQTYADVGKEAFSIIGMWIVNVSQIASQLLYCCSYMMIMTENLEYIVPSVRQEIWVMALVAIFYLTSFFRSMRVLSMISVTANLALVIAVVLVFSSLLITGDRKTAEIVSFQGSGAPLMIGITLFSFEGIGLVIPMQGSMAQPQHYGKSLTFVLFLVFILDFLFGTICYASLGTSTPELISRAVSSEYPTLKTLSILLIISSLGASYDLLLIPVFTTIDESSHLRSMRRRHKKATRIASSLLDLTVICVSVLPSLTPIRTHFPAFISFIGATVGSESRSSLDLFDEKIPLDVSTGKLLRQLDRLSMVVIFY